MEELYRRAAALDGRISIATVYRTVRLLEEKGILERRDFGGGRARYEPTEHGHHYHLIDIDTGRVIEFEDAEHERVMQAIAARLGFDLVSLRLELFGRKRRSARASVGAEASAREPPLQAEPKPRRARRDPDPRPGREPSKRSRPVTVQVTVQKPIGRGAVPGIGELRAGNLGVRIAATADEIDAVQALRFRVFYGEMGAAAATATHREPARPGRVRRGGGPSAGGRPRDRARARRRRRHLPADPARRRGRGSAGSTPPTNTTSPRSSPFPAACLNSAGPASTPRYRGRAVMQLLWRGIAAYVFYHDRPDVRLRQPARDRPGRVGAELTYLYYNHLAPPALRPRALPERYVDMRRMDPEAARPAPGARPAAAADQGLSAARRLRRRRRGDRPAVQHDDVAIVVKTDLVTDKYYRHYERQLREALD